MLCCFRGLSSALELEPRLMTEAGGAEEEACGGDEAISWNAPCVVCRELVDAESVGEAVVERGEGIFRRELAERGEGGGEVDRDGSKVSFGEGGFLVRAMTSFAYLLRSESDKFLISSATGDEGRGGGGRAFEWGETPPGEEARMSADSGASFWDLGERGDSEEEEARRSTSCAECGVKAATRTGGLAGVTVGTGAEGRDSFDFVFALGCEFEVGESEDEAGGDGPGTLNEAAAVPVPMEDVALDPLLRNIEYSSLEKLRARGEFGESGDPVMVASLCDDIAAEFEPSFEAERLCNRILSGGRGPAGLGERSLSESFLGILVLPDTCL